MSGLGPETFAFFAGLEANNHKEWFHAHRGDYDAFVRDPLEALLASTGETVKLARPNRDIRFSPDKTPYKDRAYGFAGDPPLYAELSARGLVAGAGLRHLDLDRFRAAVDRDDTPARIVEALHAAGLETWGEALKRVPAPYAKDHPRGALLRHKMLIATARLAPEDVTDAAAREHCRATWAACEPLRAWLAANAQPR